MGSAFVRRDVSLCYLHCDSAGTAEKDGAGQRYRAAVSKSDLAVISKIPCSYCKSAGCSFFCARAVRAGKGFIVLHYHNLSQAMEEKSREAVGQPAQLFSLAKDRKTQMECSKFFQHIIMERLHHKGQKCLMFKFPGGKTHG